MIEIVPLKKVNVSIFFATPGLYCLVPPVSAPTKPLCTATVKSETSGDERGTPCMFPFKLGNATYNECVRVDGREGLQCPLGTAKDGRVASYSNWRYGDWHPCRAGCPVADT